MTSNQNPPITRRGALLGSTAVLSSLAGCAGLDSLLGPDGNTAEATVESLPTPTRGQEEAPVTMQVFKDYACPPCQAFSFVVEPQLQAEYIDPGSLRFEFFDFPIPVDDEWSWKVASAARAVQDTVSQAAFFDFQSGIFEHLGSYSIEVIGTTAESVGADPDTVRQAATNMTYKPVMDANKQTGLEMGVQGTPTVFIDGQMQSDFSFDALAATIDSKLN